MAGRGTGETKGEKGPDSAESESRSHGLTGEGEGASSKGWLSTQASPAHTWVRLQVI